MNEQSIPPPGWYPDPREKALVRFWDGRQWTGRTSPAYPPPPPAGATSSSSMAGRWQSFRLRTKVLLVVGALIMFGALLPDDDVEPASAGGQTARTSDPDTSDGGEVDESAEDSSDEEAETAAAEEPEEPEEQVIEEIAVPALKAKQVAQARKALRRSGLAVEIVRQPSWQPAGQVVKQGTKAGAALVAGSVVTLVVAAPMPRVPGVLGKGAAIAQSALTRAGFEVNIVKETVTSGTNNAVLRQTPSATQQAAPGSVVQLVVSNVIAPPPPPKPTPVPLASNCTSGYKPCLPPASDYDCAGGSGDGPGYAVGPVYIAGSDPYDLDSDGDGVACES